MDDKNLFNDLRCYLMPAKFQFCARNHRPLYESAFLLWYDNTKAALLEEKNIEIASTLSSDGFYEYDEFVLITHEQTPIGIFMFRWHDLSNPITQLLSAIQKRFPESLIEQLLHSHHHRIMTMGNLAVDPAWRRHFIGFGVADMLMGLAVRRFLISDAHALLTTTRNNRSTHHLCYRQGGQKFASNEKVFGVPSDVVLFYRGDVKPHPEADINHKSTLLWSSKINGWDNDHAMSRVINNSVCH